jgi:hypothetical protein
MDRQYIVTYFRCCFVGSALRLFEIAKSCCHGTT